VSRPDKKANFHRRFRLIYLFIDCLSTAFPVWPNKMIGHLSCGNTGILLDFGRDIAFASFHDSVK
jgi:hypothetical protein